MGLLLSVLVVCVGVLEVLASIRHIQDGYLPVWTPHHAATTSGLRSLHEHLRKKTNEEVGVNNKRDCFSNDEGYVTSQQSNALLQSSSVSDDSSSITIGNGLAEHGRNLPIAAECEEQSLLLSGNGSVVECRSSVEHDNEEQVFVEQNGHVKEVSGEECVTWTRSECNEEIEACGRSGSVPDASGVPAEQLSGIRKAEDASTSQAVVTCFDDHTAPPQQDSHQSSQVNVTGDWNVGQQLQEDGFINQETYVQSQDIAADVRASLDRPTSPKTTVSDEFVPENLEIRSKNEDQAEETKSEDSLTPSGSCEEVPEVNKIGETKSEGSLTPSESCQEVPEASKEVETEDAVPEVKRKEEHSCAELSSFDQDVQDLRALLREDSEPSKPVEGDVKKSRVTDDKASMPFVEVAAKEEADTCSDPEDLDIEQLRRDDLKLTFLPSKPVHSPPVMSSPGTARKSRTDISWPTFCPTTPVIKRPSIPLITSESMSIDQQPRFTHRHSEGDTSVHLQAHSELPPFSQSGEDLFPEAFKDDTSSEIPYKPSKDCKILSGEFESIQKPGESKGITQYPTKSSIKDKFKNRDSNDDVSSFSRSQADDNEASISGDSFDVDGSEVSSSDISMKNEFSRKEMGIRRRRSYRKKRQTSSTESLPRSEEDEAEDKTSSSSKFAATSDRQLHNKPSKAFSLENISSQDFDDRRAARKQHTSFDDREEAHEDIRVRRNTAGGDDVFEEDVETEESELSSNPLVAVKTEKPSETKSIGIPKTNNENNVESKRAVGTKGESETGLEPIGQRKETKTVECERVKPVGSDSRVDQGRHEDDEDSTVSDSSSAHAKSAPIEAFWLIFSGEYTKAMSKDWHSGHFCCWQCDESLTGQRYVLRDDHPYCIKCYESVFANNCEECNKTIGIDSKDLSYKDKHWHEACFLCNKCRVSLVDKQFGSKADKIYCGNCYDAQFASRCDGCGEIFRAGTKKMEYKTRQWHEKCFCCCVCKSAIGTKSFIPREQEIYCATCYEEKFATRCVKCNKIITSGGVTYKNEPWHRECFTCTNCNTSLAGQRFTSRDEKPYCAECFGELFAKRCTACVKPITGIGGTRFISFEDRHWHNDCFICASCNTSLVGRGFITDADDIICPDCAKTKLM